MRYALFTSLGDGSYRYGGWIDMDVIRRKTNPPVDDSIAATWDLRLVSEAPNPLSSRVSWWPLDKAPEAIVRVTRGRLLAHALADIAQAVPDRPIWVGCCGVKENPSGFPAFMDVPYVQQIGSYWFGLSYW